MKLLLPRSAFQGNYRVRFVETHVNCAFRDGRSAMRSHPNNDGVRSKRLSDTGRTSLFARMLQLEGSTGSAIMGRTVAPSARCNLFRVVPSTGRRAGYLTRYVE
jgi:hypothetical protein